MANNKERHRVIAASYVILRRGNEILLQKRANTGYEDGNYGLVSGHVEQGETYSQAIIREAKEEAGLELKPEYLRFAHFMHRKDKGEDNERADVFFAAEHWEGEVKNMEPHKCDDLSWFPIDNLPENTISYIRLVVDNIEKEISYSEFGWSDMKIILGSQSEGRHSRQYYWPIQGTYRKINKRSAGIEIEHIYELPKSCIAHTARDR